MSRFEELIAKIDAQEDSGPWTCGLHGEFGSAEKPADGYSGCPDCATENRQQEIEFNSLCRRWSWWANHSGIPGRYRSRTVATWQPKGQQASVKAVQRYVTSIADRVSAGEGLTLLGPPGVGKTHLLTAIVTEACRAGHRAVYASWPSLMERARQAARSRSGNPVDSAGGADFLAVDELGLGQGTKWEQTQLFELLDWRYSQALPTCVASNAPTAELPERIGERLADRLRETNTTLLVTGQSHRDAAHEHPTDQSFPKPEPMTIRRCAAGAMLERVLRNPDLHGREM